MEEERRICSCCGGILDEDDYGAWVGNDLLCETCMENECIVCEHCGEVVYADDAECDDSISLCESCFSDYYSRCECCNQIIRNSYVNWRGDLPYCDNCYNEFTDEIEEYGYKPEPIFHGEDSRYFGVELEVDCGGKDDENARTLKDIANIRTENIYIKSDGSIDDGFEIVSHPMTLEYHLNEMDWESVMQEAVNLGYRSHQTSTCGLHVHVNRDSFGLNQSEQEEVIGKILFFVEKHWAELFQFSRRSNYNMNRWSARYGFEKTGKEILQKAKDTGNRYVAVNLRNYHTIEFRLFLGTLKYNTFVATLQMVNHICEVAVSMSEREIDEMSWCEFVSSIEESELVEYLKERRLYVNELVKTAEGGEE